MHFHVRMYALINIFDGYAKETILFCLHTHEETVNPTYALRNYLAPITTFNTIQAAAGVEIGFHQIINPLSSPFPFKQVS